MTVRPVFAWYDFWIGLFYDRGKRRLYVFPVPCVGFYLQFKQREVVTPDIAEGCVCRRRVCSYDLDFGCGSDQSGAK